jgi:protein-tyrosine phosphatase
VNDNNEKGTPMKILFLCTDNFTRSIIAEYCFKDFLTKNQFHDVEVSSAGIRAHSDVSQYSTLHFEIMEQLGIETKDWKRTQFTSDLIDRYDLVIGMSELHKSYIQQEFKRDIPLFNEIYTGQLTAVHIGAPDSENFKENMRQLVQFFYDAMPVVYRNVKEKTFMA